MTSLMEQHCFGLMPLNSLFTLVSGSEFLQMIGSFCGNDMPGGASRTMRQVVEYYWHDNEDWLSFDFSSLLQTHAPFLNQMNIKLSDARSSAAFIEHFQDMTCQDFLDEFISNFRIYPKLNSMSTKDVHCLPGLCDKRTSLLFNTPPEVYAYKRNAGVETNTILVCMATGFISLDIFVQIKQDGRTLTESDGLSIGDLLPNEDNTFQRKVQVEILKSDKSNFTCEVSSDETKLSLTKVWGKKHNEEQHLPLSPVALSI